ncbi:hypothetical protein GHT06_012309 [Daphnia sinensis]|uniref:Replication protein A 70 kDa DNA-binding subunit B/D first OB fold domain-containing protein n=1 Tax=Daphnia sinensis TaxID=1820382 RepID=A0AAD5KY56_9CRUS|nr:hypothetical protein GHT06_012309 [Daphnia sinensis]
MDPSPAKSATKRKGDGSEKTPSPMKMAFKKENEEAKTLFGPKTISELNSSCQNWTLIARLIRSFAKPVTMKNERVNTLNLIFIDHTGEIRVEAWRNNAAKWIDKLQVNTIYKLTGCTVKQIDDRSKPYTRLPNPYKIYINEKSRIDAVNMDQKANDEFSNLHFEFKDFQSISTGTLTDVYGLVCDMSLDAENESIVLRQPNSNIKVVINDIHWILDNPTIKNGLKKNETVVAIRGIQVMEILPNIIKTKLYEDSSLMINPRKTGILPTLMEEWLDDVLNSDTDEDSQDEVHPTGTTDN